VDAAGFGQFANGDGAVWVDAALVNPFLDAVEVGGCEVESETALPDVRKSPSSFSLRSQDRDIHVVEPTLTVHHNLRRLSTIEPRGDFSMLLLTLVATSRGLTLTGRRTTTSPNSLIVRPRSIGQRR
jgi:hypothetical protein